MENREMQKIEIHLRSVQRREGDTETVEQTLAGTLTRFENGWRVAYREDAEAGMGKTDTTLTVMEGRVILDRRGETACRMVFRAGRRTFTEYRTLYGTFPVEIMTRKAESVLAEGELTVAGRIFLDYDLALGGDIPTQTALELSLTALDGSKEENRDL